MILRPGVKNVFHFVYIYIIQYILIGEFIDIIMFINEIIHNKCKIIQINRLVAEQ